MLRAISASIYMSYKMHAVSVLMYSDCYRLHSVNIRFIDVDFQNASAHGGIALPLL